MTVTTYTARRNSLLAVCRLDLPGSAYHHTLCPRLHDLHEGAMVEEATLPGTLWSCIYREEAWLVWQRVQQKKRQGNRRENWVHSFHGASKSLVLFLLQSEVVYFFPPESVILAATMMDGFIKRLTQLFFCRYTPTNMPSLWGYHSIKPRHSSLPETSTGFQHGPPLQSLCCPKL